MLQDCGTSGSAPCEDGSCEGAMIAIEGVCTEVQIAPEAVTGSATLPLPLPPPAHADLG